MEWNCVCCFCFIFRRATGLYHVFHQFLECLNSTLIQIIVIHPFKLDHDPNINDIWIIKEAEVWNKNKVLMSVIKNIIVLWDVTLCSLGGRYQCFGGTYSLQLQAIPDNSILQLTVCLQQTKFCNYYSVTLFRRKITGSGKIQWGTLWQYFSLLLDNFIYMDVGRAIAKAVSCQFPTTVAWARAQVRSCGSCGGQSGTGAGFLQGLRFPLPILISPTPPHSSSVIWGWYNRPVSGWCTKWTQSHPTPGNLKKKPTCMFNWLILGFI
jgi:hypothetical protein